MIRKLNMNIEVRETYHKCSNLLMSTSSRRMSSKRPSRFSPRCFSATSDSSARPQKEVPPLLLYQTASPYVYISSIAIDQSENPIHPKSFFTETQIPKLFRTSQFAYISPKEWNHELPKAQIPEVAFLGRSNVGKSSLLNALTMQKNLAKTSKTPGRTQSINYYGLFDSSQRSSQNATSITKSNSLSFSSTLSSASPHDPSSALGYIIDLPGYGYAKAPEKNIDEWQMKTQEFLQERRLSGHLQRVYLLVDARRGLGPFDSSICSWLDEAECSYSILLTKSDAVGKSLLVKAANEICMRYYLQHCKRMDNNNNNNSEEMLMGSQGSVVHSTSAKKNQGIMELMYSIETDFYVGMERFRMLNE